MFWCVLVTVPESIVSVASAPISAFCRYRFVFFRHPSWFAYLSSLLTHLHPLPPKAGPGVCWMGGWLVCGSASLRGYPVVACR